MKRHTLLILVTILIAALVSCSYENTATVTIDTGIRQQAQLNWFDRVLAFLSLSQPLQADPVPGQLGIYYILINVSANDIATITREIPIETGTITLEVPAGNQRTFEVVAYNNGENLNRLYGGISKVDLSPGQNVNLNIQMGELFYIIDGNPYYYQNQSREWVIEIPAYKQYNPVAFKIYKMVNDQWVLEATITNFTSAFAFGVYTYTIKNLILNTAQYSYSLTGVNIYGEGDMYGISL